ncbi:hypothetical protein IH980_03180 [Patescibacteria group bacterium]|nr:hypothetical protein [Patescibacteria group bacterium]
MPSRDRLQRQLLELSIVTLVTIIIWTGYEVYNALTQPVETRVTKAELQPLPSSLDLEQFDPLRDRLVIDDEAIARFSFSSDEFPEAPVVPTPTPTAPSPEATPSSEATPSASTP